MSSKLNMNFIMTKDTGDTKIDNFEDEDVICLSSDTDDEPVPPVAKTGKQEISNGNNNNALKRKLPPAESLSRKRKSPSINGVQITTSSVTKPERVSPTLSSVIIEEIPNEDEDFEIEYVRDISDTNSNNGLDNPRSKHASNSDDDIQVLDENESEDASVPVIISTEHIINNDPVPGCSSVVNNGPSIINHSLSPQQQSWNLLKMLLAQVKKNGKNEHAVDKVEVKYKKLFEDVKEFKAETHKCFHEHVENAISNLVDFPDKTWRYVNEVKKLLKSETFQKLKTVSPAVRLEQRMKKKTELTTRYEGLLQKLHNKIKDLREAEVDWDDEDEHNSAYIMEEKYKKKFMADYYKLCDIHKCNKFTDRPIQKKINLKKLGESSGYNEIDDEVEKFLNKQGFLYIPDFTDVLNIIKKVNIANGLNLTTETSLETAKKIFEKVALLIQKRREKDLKLTLFESILEGCQNPAEEDEELERKLQENDKLRKKESDVLDHFNKLAEDQGRQAKEVAQNEEANASPLPSDDEDDDEDEGDTETEEDEDAREKRRSLEAHQHEELTEDEDEESNSSTVTNVCGGTEKTNTGCSRSSIISSKANGDDDDIVPIPVVDQSSSQSQSSPNGIKRIVPTRLDDEPINGSPDLVEVKVEETSDEITALN